MTIQKPMCNEDILQLLANRDGRTIFEMATHFHVSKTVIRGRLIRLMLAQSVTRKCMEERQQGGRPQHLYYITNQGRSLLTETADNRTT